MQSKNGAQTKIFTFSLLFFFSLLITVCFSLWQTSANRPLTLAKKMETALDQKKTKAQELQRKFFKSIQHHPNTPLTKISELKNQCNVESPICLIYQKDSLVFWSQNKPSIPVFLDSITFKSRIAHLSVGWYQVTKTTQQPYTIILLDLIKSDYPYQNEFLKNKFLSDFSASDDWDITLKPTQTPIREANSQTYAFLKRSNNLPVQDYAVLIFTFLYLITWSFYFLLAFELLKKIPLFHRRPGLFLFLFILDTVVLRWFLIWISVPRILLNSTLFSPFFYATSNILPSLGDFLINSYLFFFILALFFKKIHLTSFFHKLNQNFKKAYAFGAVSACIIIFEFMQYLYKGLIQNSNLPYNLNNVFTLSPFTLIAFLITALILFSTFILIHKLIFPLSLLKTHYRGILIFTSLPLLIYVILSITILHTDPVFPVFVALFVLSSYLINHYNQKPFSFGSVLFYTLSLTLLSTYLLLNNQEIREKNERKLLAQKLSSDRDPLAEYLASSIFRKMQHDPKLNDLLYYANVSENAENRAVDYINAAYFNNFWLRYNHEITLCTSDKMLNVVIPNNTIINCNQYFSQIIKSVGQPTISENLYYLDYGSESTSYLAVFPFVCHHKGDSSNINIYIDITSKSVPRGVGYPELLVDQKSRISPDLTNYSYAFYKNGELTRNSGKYPYSLTTSQPKTGSDKFLFYDLNNYSHLYYQSDKNKCIIISIKKKTTTEIISPFSYLFILYLFTILVFLVFHNSVIRLFSRDNSLKNRLQYSMVTLILSSFIVIGISSWFFIVRLNNNKNIDVLSEKAHSILIEIQQRLPRENSITPDMGNDLYFLLNKLSLTFFSDINLYNLSGDLIASSRPQIFEEGLLSTKMNPVSYHELADNNKSNFIHNEMIGNYRFLSAYLPIRNNQDRIIGYLNLPYFARQTEIRNEISNFLVSFVNIYIILISLSVLLALLMATAITRPLSLITAKIGGIKLGNPNEKISWEKNDEISVLVNEYNKMIDQLAYSADQLARSERESAWREMAKQVAHEIKNPLTPMKLSIQYLQRAWDEKAGDWDERLKRSTQTLIEQIDTLSNIATEFSDFAKMPVARNDWVSLQEIIRSSASLYQETNSFTIELNLAEEEEFLVRADKQQLLRVFTNLIKNAIQAFDPDRNGVIILSLIKNSDSCLISVSDNGLGIPFDQQDKIFSPNFTTKSGGMGLGLAMVKSIINEAGGNITFESVPGQGTTFHITLPLHDNK